MGKTSYMRWGQGGGNQSDRDEEEEAVLYMLILYRIQLLTSIS